MQAMTKQATRLLMQQHFFVKHCFVGRRQQNLESLLLFRLGDVLPLPLLDAVFVLIVRMDNSDLCRNVLLLLLPLTSSATLSLPFGFAPLCKKVGSGKNCWASGFFSEPSEVVKPCSALTKFTPSSDLARSPCDVLFVPTMVFRLKCEIA